MKRILFIVSLLSVTSAIISMSEEQKSRYLNTIYRLEPDELMALYYAARKKTKDLGTAVDRGVPNAEKALEDAEWKKRQIYRILKRDLKMKPPK